MNTRNGG